MFTRRVTCVGLDVGCPFGPSVLWFGTHCVGGHAGLKNEYGSVRPGSGGVAPNGGTLSTCSKVAHAHCGRVGVFCVMCRPTRPSSPFTQFAGCLDADEGVWIHASRRKNRALIAGVSAVVIWRHAAFTSITPVGSEMALA